MANASCYNCISVENAALPMSENEVSLCIEGQQRYMYIYVKALVIVYSAIIAKIKFMFLITNFEVVLNLKN